MWPATLATLLKVNEWLPGAFGDERMRSAGTACYNVAISAVGQADWARATQLLEDLAPQLPFRCRSSRGEGLRRLLVSSTTVTQLLGVAGERARGLMRQA